MTRNSLHFDFACVRDMQTDRKEAPLHPWKYVNCSLLFCIEYQLSGWKWLPLILSVRSTFVIVRMRIIKWFKLLDLHENMNDGNCYLSYSGPTKCSIRTEKTIAKKAFKDMCFSRIKYGNIHIKFESLFFCLDLNGCIVYLCVWRCPCLCMLYMQPLKWPCM